MNRPGSDNPDWLKLICHPATPSTAANQIDVKIAQTANGNLTLTYRLKGNITALAIPPSNASTNTSTITDNLWQHTCFEAFIMATPGADYREFNFSPSGEWAVYNFSDYRVRSQINEDSKALLTIPAPSIKVTQDDGILVLIADLPSDLIPQTGVIKAGLSAVIEADTGGKSYWALQHPPGQPDFHHKDAFVVQLDTAS